MMGKFEKRGKNLKFIIEKLQEGISKVVNWSYKWGVNFSVDKTKVMLFTRKRSNINLNLELYNQNLERVKCLTFL